MEDLGEKTELFWIYVSRQIHNSYPRIMNKAMLLFFASKAIVNWAIFRFVGKSKWFSNHGQELLNNVKQLVLLNATKYIEWHYYYISISHSRDYCSNPINLDRCASKRHSKNIIVNILVSKDSFKMFFGCLCCLDIPLWNFHLY